jgi:O-antigen ligase
VNLNSFVAWLTSACLVLFAYSGLMKWLPVFPVDPTLLFGGGLALLTGLAVVRHAPRTRGLVDLTVLVTLCFFAWYALTGIYSISSEFWVRKELTLALDLLAFLVPLACFTQQQHFRAFNFTVVILALAATAIVLGMYAAGTIALLLAPKGNPLSDKLPDYLAIGSLVGCGVLLLMARPRLVNMGLALAGLAAMLVLAARGPTLFLVLLIPLGIVLYRRRTGAPKSGAWRYLLVLIAASLAFTQWKGAESALTRFSKIFDSDRDLDKALRVDEFIIAGDVIAERPFFGVGLGGYGTAGYGLDDDVYPHNLFLEAFAEGGVPGVLLFATSIILVFAVALTTRRRGAMPYFMLFLFLVFNYCKSGGFVGARDLYMCMGVFLAYVNASAVEDERLFSLGWARAASRA